MYSQCNIVFNRKLSHKFEKCCKYLSHITVKTLIQKLYKTVPACIKLYLPV
jgi:hypothetical protein